MKVVRMMWLVVVVLVVMMVKIYGLLLGRLNLIYDMVIYVGGVNVGMRFSRRISRKSIVSVSMILILGVLVLCFDCVDERC